MSSSLTAPTNSFDVSLRYDALFENTQDGIFIIDLHNTIVKANRRAATMLGYDSPSALVGKTGFEVLASPHAEQSLNIREQLLREDTLPILDRTFICRDGTALACEINIALVRDDAGEPLYIQCIARDVRERRTREQQLRDSQEHYRTLVESMTEGVVMQLASGEIVTCNASAERILGLSADQLSGRTSHDPRWRAIHPDGSPFPGEDHPAMVALRTGEAQTTVTMGIHKPDGAQVWISVNAQPLFRDGETTPYAVVATFTDITELHDTARALSVSESLYRDVVETQTDFIKRYTPDFTLLFVNRAYVRLYNTTPEALVGRDMLTLIDGQSVDQMRTLIAGLTPDAPTRSGEYSRVLPDGRTLWHQWIDHGVFDAHGKLIEVQSSGRDVTALKEAEAAWRLSEARYRAVVDLQTEYIHRYQPDFTITFVNEAYARYIGQPSETLIGRSLLDVVHPVTAKYLQQRLVAFTPEQPIIVEEFPRRLEGGGWLWHEWADHAIFDEQGRLVEIQAVGRDITRQKLYEQELRMSEARYRAVVEDQLDFINRYSYPDFTLRFVNKPYADYWGTTPNAMLGRSLFEFVAADNAARMQETISRMTPARPTVVGEYTQRDRHGRRIWHQWTDTGIFDDDGRLIEVQGVGRDITALKEAEAALRLSEARYRAVVEDQRELICRYRLDERLTITFVNRAYARNNGTTVEALIGKSLFTVVSPMYELILRSYLAKLTPEQPYHISEAYETTTSGDRWFEWQDNGIFDEQGQLIEVQSVGHDITALKQTEAALRLSEERYRAVVELQTEMVGRYTPDTTLTFANEAYARNLNSSAEALLGKRLLDLVEETYRPLIQQQIAQLTIEQPVVAQEYFYASASGATGRWEQWVLRGVFDPIGQLVEVLAVGRDITQLKVTEAALLESERRFRQMADNIPQALWMVDLEDQLLFANPMYGEMLGYPEEEYWSGKRHFRDSVHPDDTEQVNGALAQVMVEGEALVQYRLVRGDGAIRWIRTRVFGIPDEHGRLYRIAGICEDMTEERQYEEHERQLVLERDRIRILSEFVRDASHDLKTPLTILNTNLYLIRRTEDRGRIEERLRVMDEQTAQLARLIDQMLTMSNLDNQPDLHVSTVDLNRLVREIDVGFMALAEQNSQRLTLILDEALPLIHGDVFQLNRAMTNIVENAFKYTPAGGVITLQTRQTADAVQVIVSDTGMGIAPEDMPYIFDRFYRADRARSHETGGTGLGLAITRRIIEMHGGTITVDSLLGSGTRFTVTLPRTG